MKKSIISESQILAPIKEQESEKRWRISAARLEYIRLSFTIGRKSIQGWTLKHMYAELAYAYYRLSVEISERGHTISGQLAPEVSVDHLIPF